MPHNIESYVVFPSRNNDNIIVIVPPGEDGIAFNAMLWGIRSMLWNKNQAIGNLPLKGSKYEYLRVPLSLNECVATHCVSLVSERELVWCLKSL